MTLRFHSVCRPLALAVLTSAAWLISCHTALSAQATLRQYLSGRDAESPQPWEFSCSGGRNSGVWSKIGVPSCWELQGFGTFRYGFQDKSHEPIRGDYRHRFQVPADWQGRRVFIVFAGVMTDATVKINGTEAGPQHQGSFYQFKHDITGLLRFGAENLLEVSVLDRSENASVNAAERNGDFWVFGGIYRPVWLQVEPGQFIDHVAIDAKADGTFTLDYFLAGEAGADAVSVTLVNAGGKIVGEPVSVPVAAGRVATRIAHPELWSAETPALHTALVQLKKGTTVLHEIKRRFGFRTIEVRAGDGIYINGHRVMMRGICHHVAWPTLGRASSPRIAALDLDLIQEMNMNAVRMTHYPPDEDFLEMCDERGLYVLDELAGWHGYYDDETGHKLVREMVTRDVNHPAIILWDNGNEGGFNTNLDDDFHQLDPQRRPVIHPWAKFGQIDTSHYPDFKGLTKLLGGNQVVMPTEFLHGLYDGGHGAGLEDYWQAMCNSSNSAGGFLWVFADEGVQRGDMDNKIDVNGNFAPDGIVGPFREKEGSFYTVKELWSPLRLPRILPADFNGTLPVENRYEVTSLARCSFRWQLRRFSPPPVGASSATAYTLLDEGAQAGPEVAAGQSGILPLGLPAAWRDAHADALAVTAIDYNGRELWTWVYPLQAQATSVPPGRALDLKPTPGEWLLHAGGTELRIEPDTGSLLGVKVDGREFSLRGGPVAGARWQALDSGWFKLVYTADPAAPSAVVGVAFDYPEEKMLKKTWLGNGPYRVWRNRQVGGSLGVWETPYNQTATGWMDWEYPEFGGYFSGVRWLRLTTTEGAVTLMIPDENKFVRVATPRSPGWNLMAKLAMTFPPGNLAVLGDIPPIGNKFHAAGQTGPQATAPLARAPYQGTIYLRFEPRIP